MFDEIDCDTCHDHGQDKCSKHFPVTDGTPCLECEEGEYKDYICNKCGDVPLPERTGVEEYRPYSTYFVCGCWHEHITGDWDWCNLHNKQYGGK